MQISKKVNKSAISAHIWTKFGMIVGDRNLDEFLEKYFLHPSPN